MVYHSSPRMLKKNSIRSKQKNSVIPEIRTYVELSNLWYLELTVANTYGNYKRKRQAQQNIIMHHHYFIYSM